MLNPPPLRRLRPPPVLIDDFLAHLANDARQPGQNWPLAGSAPNGLEGGEVLSAPCAVLVTLLSRNDFHQRVRIGRQLPEKVVEGHNPD
jgi:hypothetical protein